MKLTAKQVEKMKVTLSLLDATAAKSALDKAETGNIADIKAARKELSAQLKVLDKALFIAAPKPKSE